MRHKEYEQYDHSRARECLGFALGFLMNYDLWWTLEFRSRSFPYPSQNGEKIVVKRMRTRRLRFRTVAVTTSNHIDISTYRHIDLSQGLLSFAKNYHIWYMMWFLFRHVPVQKLSHLMWWNLFRFVLLRNHHIWCGFFSVIFLFRNFHIWCEVCSDLFLFRNDHIWCDSCSEIVLFRHFHISC